MRAILLIFLISLLGCINDHGHQNDDRNSHNNIIIINDFLKKKVDQYIEYLPITQQINGKNNDTIIVSIQRRDSFYSIELYNESPRYSYDHPIGMNDYKNGIKVYFLIDEDKKDNPFIEVAHKFKYRGPVSSELDKELHDLPYPGPWRFYFKEDSLIKQVLPNESGGIVTKGCSQVF